MWASSYPCLGAGHLTDDPPSLAVAPSFSSLRALSLQARKEKKMEKKTQAAMSALASLCGGTCENIRQDSDILTWQG